MRTLILDCQNIAYIQRFALGEKLTFQDEQTGVMWGFFNAVLRLARDFDTRRFIFAWDSQWYHRTKVFPEYKGNRTVDLTEAERDTRRKVHQQFNLLRDELLPGLGFQNVYSIPGFEADDLIAMFVLDYAWGERGETPVVVSTDEDMYQLLDYCDVLRPLSGSKRELVTRDVLAERHGVTPEQWLEARTLMGDSSDNLPGIAGVGIKTALGYVRHELKLGKALAKIAAGQEVRDRNRRLMKLPWDPAPRAELRPEHGLSLDAFLRMCDRYNFQSFTKAAALKEWRERFDLR